ncbi:MAG: hypothetical protein WD557_09290 [Dehalococcoidia bacterium]
MSRLQKAISRIQRREPARGIGFGARSRGEPRAVLLGVLAEKGAGAKAALEAGADIAIIRAASGAAAVTEAKAASGGNNDTALGVWLDELDDATSSALAEAGCDFAVGSLDGTAATAVDTERMGQVLVAESAMDDTTLRALANLGLEALLVEHGKGAMSLADQLQLVRLASFASTPLLVTVASDAPVAELRVLRDSGVACVLLAAGSSIAEINALSDRLRAVPARKSRRDGAEMALVPSVAAAGAHHEEEEDDDGEE